MKRIQYACLQQTIHFALRDNWPQEDAARMAAEEAANYKKDMDRKGVAYQVEEEQVLPDGSVRMKIKKQYNQYPCGEYLQ